MKNEILEIRNVCIEIMGNKKLTTNEREKAMNIIKFIDTYTVSVDILRKYNPEYYTSDELANIRRFMSNYETDIQYLYANNDSVIRYVKTKGDK